VYEGDLYAALPDELRGRVDLLVANAPYVPSGEVALMPREAREFEPPVALDGGSDGLELHRRIAGDAPAWLAPTGWLLIETSERQAEATCDIVAAAGLIPEVVRADDVDGTAVAARAGDGSPLG
jgi:release factor glutamine methyltransferase